MALLSDIDWAIIAVVAVFLLFGRDNTQAVRTLGRWYARAVRLKQELLSELTRAADLPTPPPGTPLSIRGALLGLTPESGAGFTGPMVESTPPPVAAYASAAPPPPPFPWTGGYPVPSWSMTVSPAAAEARSTP